MQKIDAHSHVGYFGGWADVGYTDEQMVAEMDQYGICLLYTSQAPATAPTKPRWAHRQKTP